MSNPNQKTNIVSSFSDFTNILFSALQGSILGPLLFIICIWDLFIEHHAIEFASYVDYTIPYTYGQSFDQTIEKLETDTFVSSFTITVLKPIQENFIFH